MPRKVKEVKYRLLNAGERLKLGDDVWATPGDSLAFWKPIIAKFVGKVVDPLDPPCRRPMK